MLKIKYTNNFPQWPLLRHSPDNSGRWDNCQFYVNQDIEECDYWIVFEGLNKPETVKCPPENIIFITAEPPSVKSYNEEFLKQFATVITCHKELIHSHIILEQQALPWHVGRRVIKEKSISFSKDYNELASINYYDKSKLISVISSDKVHTEGHRQRYEFVMTLKEYFGEKIDVFGRGRKDIEDKWDAIYPYK